MSKKPIVSGDFRRELEQQLTCAGSDVAQLSDFREELRAKKESHFCALPFYQLSIGVVDTIFNILDAADFYAGQRQIEFYDTPAVKMEGLIATLDSERRDPRNLARYSRDSGIDNHLLPLALAALFALLEQLCEGMKERVRGIDVVDLAGFFHQFKNASNEEIYGDESDADFRDFQISLDRISYDLKNLQTFLRLKEYEIYKQHPKWKVIVPGEDPDTSFDVSEDLWNRSAALHAYYEQYGNPLEGFEEMTNLLTCRYKFDKPTPVFSGNDLRPFLASTKGVNLDGEVEESSPWDFSPQLKKLLSTPINIEIALPDYACDPYSENTASLHLNPWIATAKKKMYDAFCAYCRKCEAELPDGIDRALLRLKASELISSLKDDITTTDAVRNPLIETRDTVARIDRRTQRSEKFLESEPRDGGITRSEMEKLLKKYDRIRLKPILDNTNDIKSYYNSFNRLHGLDKLDPRRIPLIRKAIEHSHMTPYPVVQLKRAPGKKNKPTLAKLARIVWDNNPNDQAGFKNFECYKSAIYDQAKEHEESFLWIPDKAQEE